MTSRRRHLNRTDMEIIVTQIVEFLHRRTRRHPVLWVLIVLLILASIALSGIEMYNRVAGR
ncbi:hypothetical protein [Thalassovita mangrovi]|uniref:Uncharacterized protein n=1 Tax=Thalassovita mangrovi TaxID=2692236 RepID=A0A6L8LN67_9RHOB|nr:hypothetical protein [Thalassovita mangrovi]MYM56496.1 hypothetical protein [Thalassovita mangrovi]